MSEFEAPEADVVEQDRDLLDTSRPVATPPFGTEAPEADALEQQTPASGAVDATELLGAREVDEADHAEQRRSVEFDEDEYR